MFAIGAVMAPEMVPPLEATLARVGETFAPYDAGRYSSFTEQPYDVARMFSAPALERLRDVRARYDPDGVFRACHPV
jgi:hypothetical protein